MEFEVVKQFLEHEVRISTKNYKQFMGTIIQATENFIKISNSKYGITYIETKMIATISEAAGSEEGGIF